MVVNAHLQLQVAQCVDQPLDALCHADLLYSCAQILTAKRDAQRLDTGEQIAAKAQQYYVRPLAIGIAVQAPLSLIAQRARTAAQGQAHTGTALFQPCGNGVDIQMRGDKAHDQTWGLTERGQRLVQFALCRMQRGSGSVPAGNE